MRIKCEAQVVNRKLPTLAMKDKRPSRSSLGIGKNPGSKKDISSVFLHLCTAANRIGTKYKVAGNIEAVFTKFVSQGKFTVRFKEPPVDLYVTAEPILVRNFLHTLKSCLKDKDLDKIQLTSLAPVKKKLIDLPKTKMTILSQKDYPLTRSFPFSLRDLTISGIGMNRIENRILLLKKLKFIDFQDNSIVDVPIQLNQMQFLSELVLASNKISYIHPDVFTGSLRDSLYTLNLSQNQLTVIPTTICTLKFLHTLRIDNNKLKALPVQIGRLQTLRYLTAANNNCPFVPSTMSHLHLDFLDLSNNPLNHRTFSPLKRYRGVVHSLKEIAAKVCVRNNFMPTPADIPFTLARYLQSWYMCQCGDPCFRELHSAAVLPMDLRSYSTSLSMNSLSGTLVPAAVIFCSKECSEKYMTKRIL